MDTEQVISETKIQDPRIAEKAFELRLFNAPQDQLETYHKVLLKEQVKTAKKNGGRPGSIPLERRERFFDLASRGYSVDEIRMTIKMEDDWNRASSKEGRGPIAGAQDD